QELLRSLLADSVLQGELQQLMPSQDLQVFQEAMSHWETPALAWAEMPILVRRRMEEARQSSCNDCDEKEWCWWLHGQLETLVAHAGRAFRAYYDSFEAKLTELQAMLFVYGQSALLPPFLAALRVPEELGRFMALLFSRHGSNFMLSRCLSTRWGAELRKGYVAMVEQQQALHRISAQIFWEMGASSRYSGTKGWVYVAEQVVPVQSGFQAISNCLIMLRRSLKFLRQVRETGALGDIMERQAVYSEQLHPEA
ncbi:unnamed protein product, partial [Effrenium voratum]